MKLIYIFAASVFFVGCQTKDITYVPPPIVESQPSWDGEEQNSGLIDYIEGKGFVITKNAGERYKLLTRKFGQQLTPPVVSGEGLIAHDGNFILSPEYMSIFMEVSRLNKL